MSTQEICSKPHRSKQARRSAILAAACGLLVSFSSGLAVSTAAAQDAGQRYPARQHVSTSDTGWRGNPGLRPVPKVRSSEIAPSATSNNTSGTDSTRRSGWNLQWRTSPQVAAQQARQISDAAFEQAPAAARSQPAAQAPKIVATAATRVRNEAVVATASHAATAAHDAAAQQAPQPNQLRQTAAGQLQRVAWTTQQSEPARGGFSLPDNAFRDNAFRDNALTPPANAEMIPPGPALEVPGSNDIDELPPPSQPPRGLPESAPEQIPSPSGSDLQELFGEGPSMNPPATGGQSSDSEPSIRGMLQDQPAAPRRDAEQPDRRLPLRPLAPNDDSGDTEESPSDRDMFAPNPFGNRTRDAAKAQQDARDQARLQRADTSSLFNSEEGPTNSGTGLSCEDFRERIRVATIDQVSLDPSPPFRPDVIDDEEFEKLKGKFSEKQTSRTWRSIDGRALGTGRLQDLAYEKAVIVTEFGTEEELPLNRLSEADLAYISQNWGLPTECLIEQVAYTPRDWTSTTMTYTASNLHHKPLYFEEVNLERYGHTAGPLAQPIISSAHFFFNIAVLPYKMGVHSPDECQYALGYYRPGNCAPWIIPPVPLSVRGAWYQAAAMTGTALLIP